jgi:hypothetical protein
MSCSHSDRAGLVLGLVSQLGFLAALKAASTLATASSTLMARCRSAMLPLAQEKQYVIEQPPELPGDTPQQKMAMWWALYGQEEQPAGLDPVLDEARKVILDRAANTLKKPETSS